jgi:hypothetical protein
MKRHRRELMRKEIGERDVESLDQTGYPTKGINSDSEDLFWFC